MDIRPQLPDGKGIVLQQGKTAIFSQTLYYYDYLVSKIPFCRDPHLFSFLHHYSSGFSILEIAVGMPPVWKSHWHSYNPK